MDAIHDSGAILDAWDRLRDGESMKPLRDAAKCRSESDWLVGLNSLRAYLVPLSSW